MAVSLSVHVTSSDGVVVVALAGTADDAMITSLQPALVEALADARILILDLDEVADIDAAVLCTVVRALLEDARGGQLRVAARQPAVRAALAEAGMHQLVAVHPTVADAAAVDCSAPHTGNGMYH